MSLDPMLILLIKTCEKSGPYQKILSFTVDVLAKEEEGK